MNIFNWIKNEVKKIPKVLPADPTPKLPFIDDVSKLLSNDKETQKKVIETNQKDSDPAFCYIKDLKIVRDQVKPKIKEEAVSELKKQCGDYQTKYKDFADNQAIGPIVTSYASSVLNSSNQRGTLPKFDNLTIDKVCNASPAIQSYLSSSQNQQLQDACEVVKTPTINTVCNAYPAFQSYLSSSQNQQLQAACDIVKTPNANTICKAYPAFQSYLSPPKNKELGMLCNFVTSKDRMKTMCTMKNNPLVQSGLTKAQYKELSLGCNLYDTAFTKPLANMKCKTMYKDCKTTSNCCNELLTNKSMPVIDAIVKKTVGSYTKQINQQLESRVIPEINTVLRDKVQQNLPTIKKTLQNKVNSVIDPMVSQLQGGIGRADVSLGECWTKPPKTSLNNMCYNLQSNFPSGVCTSPNGCCFALLDDVCKS